MYTSDAGSDAHAQPSDAAAERTAFHLSTIHARRDPSIRITSLAADHRLHRLYIGLSNGHIEEHQLVQPTGSRGHSQSGDARAPTHHDTHHHHHHQSGSPSTAGPPTLRLVSSRKLCRSPLVDLTCVSVATRFVARSQDGAVMVCPYDTADVHTVSALRNATAIAADQSPRPPARLAVACRSSAGLKTNPPASKLIVCSVNGTTGAAITGSQPVQILAQLTVQEPILCLAWVGNSILMALPSCYRLMASGGVVTEIAPHTCVHPLVTPITHAAQALLLLNDTMVIATDVSGGAVSTPMLLGGFPLALCSVGSQVLCVTDECVEVMDRTSGQQLQTLAFSHDDAWVQAAHRLSFTPEDGGSHYVMFATSTLIYCLAAVPPEQQVQELLKRRRYHAALSLVSAACQPPTPTTPTHTSRRRTSSPVRTRPPPPAVPTWCYHTLAQTAMLLMQELRYLPALSLLLVLPPSVWQPCHLLALFPALAARWTRDLHALGKPWGGHVTLMDLRRMVTDHLELRTLTRSHPHSHTPTSHTPSLSHRSSVDGSALAPVTDTGPSTEEIDACVMHAKALIASYLIQVRTCEGVALLEAIDTLCLQLLEECGLVGQLEAAVATPGCQALLRDAATMLSAKHRWHALALLRTTHNHTSEALDIWESLGTHTLTEDTQHTSPTTPTTAQQRAYMELSQTATQVYSAHAPLGQLSVLSAFAQQQQQAVQPHSQSLATRLQQPLFMSVLPDVFERVATVEDSLSEAVGRERGDGVGVTTGPVGQEGGSGGVGQVMSGIQAAGGDQAALAAAAMSALMSYTITDVGTVGSGALAAVSAPTSTGAVAARGVRTASPTYLPELHSVQSSGVRVHMAPSMHPHRAAGRRVAPREAAFGAYLAQSAEWSDVACAGVRLPCMAVPSAPVSTEVVLSKLPWLLTAYPGEGLAVLCARPDLPLPNVLALINARTDDVRWRYLLHTLYFTSHNRVPSPTQQTPPTDTTAQHAESLAPSSAAQEHTSAAQQAQHGLSDDELSALHTELALELIECIGRALQAQPTSHSEATQPTNTSQPAQSSSSTHPAPQPAAHTDRQQTAATGPVGASSTGQSSRGANNSTGSHNVVIDSRVGWLRSVLSGHLSVSHRVDADVVLAAVHATCPGRLLREEVTLQSLRGDHPAALSLLVVQLCDVEGAIAYCRQQQAVYQASVGLGRSAGEVAQQVEQLWLSLLECCLRPGEGREPMYAAALRVLAAPSAMSGSLNNTPQLDPLKVLNALPDSMPLTLAGSTLASMTTATAHNRRNAQVLKALYRAQNLDVRAQYLHLSSQRVVITETTSCHRCNRLLAGRIFIQRPDGSLVCERCASPAEQASFGTTTANV